MRRYQNFVSLGSVHRRSALGLSPPTPRRLSIIAHSPVRALSLSLCLQETPKYTPRFNLQSSDQASHYEFKKKLERNPQSDSIESFAYKEIQRNCQTEPSEETNFNFFDSSYFNQMDFQIHGNQPQQQSEQSKYMQKAYGGGGSGKNKSPLRQQQQQMPLYPQQQQLQQQQAVQQQIQDEQKLIMLMRQNKSMLEECIAPDYFYDQKSHIQQQLREFKQRQLIQNAYGNEKQLMNMTKKQGAGLQQSQPSHQQ